MLSHLPASLFTLRPPSSLLPLSSSPLPRRWLLKPSLSPDGRPSAWLPYLLSNVIQNAVTLLRVTALRMNLCLTAWQNREGKSKWDVEKEKRGLFHAQQEGKTDRQRERGGQGKEGCVGWGGGWQVVILTEDLPFWGLHKEKRETASRRILIHNRSGFPALLQSSIALKPSTWQQLTASTAGGSADRHAAHVLRAYVSHLHVHAWNGIYGCWRAYSSPHMDN